MRDKTWATVQGINWLFPVVFFALYLLAVLLHLDYYPLNGEEPRRAIVAIEMRQSGNFILPSTLGWEYYNKPPLFNWLISASMFLTGSESEFAVRLPSLLTILLWALSNYFILKKIIPKEVAALSSLFLLTSIDIFLWGLSNGGEIDIFYSFLVYLQVVSFFYFNHTRNWTWFYVLSYLFCALGFLTKGFPSILFQGLTMLGLCVLNKSGKFLFRWHHLLGLAVFLVIVGGYFYAYSFFSSPTRYAVNLLKESFLKSAIGERSGQILNNVFQYPLSLWKVLLPWSMLLLLLIKKRKFKFCQNPFIKFLLLFIAFNFPVYWITGQPKMRYAYMFVPFFMTMLAFIYYETKQEFPELIKSIFKKLAFVFVALFISLFSLPFFINIDIYWLIFCVLLVGIYLYLYPRVTQYAIWYFGLGVVLFRFLISALYTPVWYEKLEVKYDREMAAVAQKNNFAPVNLYYKPDTLDLTIDLKLTRFNYGSIPSIPFIAYQIPYYYHRATGNIMHFDTIINRGTNYFSFRSFVKDQNIKPVHSFVDRNHNGDEVVFFKAQQ